MRLLENIKDTLQRYGILTRLIIINAAVFLTVNIVGSLSHSNTLATYLSIPLGSASAYLLKFWTLFTYMFTHAELWHVFWNMILFYSMAQIMITMLGEKKVLYVYIMGGLSGGALMVLTGLLFPAQFYGSYLLGASASVLAVGAVMAVIAPDYIISIWGVINMKYKYFFLLLFVLTTVIDMADNAGGKIAHLGGTLFGLGYGYSLRHDLRIPGLSFRKKTRLRTVHRAKEGQGGGTTDEQRMNHLLDKISRSGYDSLTKSEKDELYNLSRKN